MTLADSDIYTVEADTYDGTTVSPLRFSSAGPAGLTTGASDTPSAVFYPSYFKDFAIGARSAFGDRRTSGSADVADGDVILSNSNAQSAPLDVYKGRSFDGRQLTVRRGQLAGAYPSSYRTIMRATQHQPLWGYEDLTLRVRDARKLTTVPLQTTLYAGTNVAGVGLEGTADDLKGKPKPVAMGTSFNVSPPRVNAQKNIYQFADNSATVTDVRDGGYSLGVSFPLTSRTVPSVSDTWQDVANDGAGTYVAVGYRAGVGSRTMRSTDGGVTWTGQTVTAGGTDQFFRVMYVSGLGMWVAGGYTGATSLFYQSTNGGVSWTAVATNPFTGIINMLVYSPSLALLIGGCTGGQYATSTNGTAWTLHTITANSWNLSDGAWGKDKFVIVGLDNTGTTGLIAYSTDGLTYTQTTSVLDHITGSGNTSPPVTSVAYSDILDAFAACALASPNVESSPDGIAWTQRTSMGNTAYNNTSIATDDGLFVVGGFAGVMLTSSDVKLWTLRGAVGQSGIQGVTIAGSNVVAVGSGVAYSSAAIATYATLADLQDDTLQPAQGTYKIYSSSTGSYIRTGSPVVGVLTCDVVQGTTAADRTGAQIMVQAFKRAGLGTANTALWSEDFSNAAYTKTALTVGANATTAPDGFATADKLQETNATSSHFAYQAVVCASAQYTYSVYVKAAERTKCVVDLWDGVTGEASIGIDLSNGSTFATGIAVGSWTGISWYVEDARNGWYRVSLTATRGAGTECRLVIYTWTTAISYTGTTGSGVYAWGEQLNAGAIAKAYTPTTTVAVIGGDWRAVQIVALDAANSAEMGCWYGPDDTEAKCADPIDLAAQSLGAWWAGDANGVICTKRLIDPNQNLVTSPDTITAGAGWTYTGTLAGAAAFSTLVLGRDSIPLTRLTNASGGSAYRAITLTGNGVKRYAVVLQWDGVAGTTIHGLFDVTAGVFIALATVTWSAAGVATSPATPTNGTLIRLAALGGNAYRLVLESTTATATNTHRAYAHSTGTATSIRVGRVDVQDSVPVAVFGDGALQGFPVPLESNDQNEGISPYETRVQYARNYTVQTSGLDGAVSGAERAQFALEWRQAKSTSASVLTAHPLSQPQIVETIYSTEGDAQAEATRLQTLKGSDREWFPVPTLLTDASLNVELGDVVEVVNWRHGLAGGVLMTVLGIAPDFKGNPLAVNVLECWR